MFSHVFFGVSDFERALAFYQVVLGVLGIKQRFMERDRPWAGWQSAPDPRPLFIIGAPHDGMQHEAGNGQMVAFLASSRTVVDEAFTVALEHGGKSEGAPGLRPQYHANYYGAYFRDPEGNKVCIACHEPEA
jgi:catechol 2,3-dioxygenase-like lactoylglutathione lyase family enzyme